MDLLRREAAVLLAEELDDEPPRAAAAAARLAQPDERGLGPVVMLIMIPVLKDVLASRRACALAVSGRRCSPSPAARERRASVVEPRTVVASFYPLAWATEQVAGEPTSAEVVNLTPPGAEPHDVELSPSDVETIRDAELVVYLGGGFQPALEDAIASREGRSLDLLREGEDPHIWLDPIRFARRVERIARAVGGAARPRRDSRAEAARRRVPTRAR